MPSKTTSQPIVDAYVAASAAYHEREGEVACYWLQRGTIDLRDAEFLELSRRRDEAQRRFFQAKKAMDALLATVRAA